MTFESLQLAPALLKALDSLGFQTPTPIQQQAIPAVLSGADLMACAQTGTGKTGGFALPILQRLSQEHAPTNKRGRTIPRALILAPTRELAAQIEESVRQFSKHLKLTNAILFGGVSMNPQIQKLQRGVDIIIATPGRLLDLHEQGFVDFSRIQTLVLDEADRMLDMGFIVDIKKILELLPKQKQSLLFSATFSDEIRDLAQEFLHDPLTIEVARRNTTVELIQQVVHPVARERKLELLIKLIKDNQWFQVLIFTRTKFGANKVEEALVKNGIRSAALHGNKSQSARTSALKDFKSGRVQALVATDIAARGIDIDQLACVINYELPNVSEDYVHRIGRTGRAGASGVAISLVTVDEAGFMQQIEKLTQQPAEVIPIEGFLPAATERAQPIVMGRQVLWGGIGKAPSRHESAGLVKAARKQMSQPRRNSQRPSAGTAPKERSATGAPRRSSAGAPQRERSATGEPRRSNTGAPQRERSATSEPRRSARPATSRSRDTDGNFGQERRGGARTSQATDKPSRSSRPPRRDKRPAAAR